MRKIFALISPLIILYSCTCNNGSEKKANVPEVNASELPSVKVDIKRYEKALFGLDKKSLPAELKRIQPEYAVFLDGDLNDPQNIRQMSDYLDAPEILDNYNACLKKYPDLGGLEKELSGALSHVKYYFPALKIPRLYTYISGGDFSQPVKYADTSLIIALDMYLGRDYPFYSLCGIPLYKSRFMDTPYITRDCIEEIAISICESDIKDATFLDQMISMGKVMYLLDAAMPETPDSIKMKYSRANLNWCERNEGNIWSFFIENKILYSRDRNTLLKFFGDGPFTASFGKESPPRIALWVGRQIIRAWMNEAENNDLKSMIAEKNSQKILQASKYKPKKEK